MAKFRLGDFLFAILVATLVLESGTKAESEERKRDRTLLGYLTGDVDDCVVQAEGTPQIIECHGYASDPYTTRSEDGYLLTMFRIRQGKSTPKRDCGLREPVVLHHGFVHSSSDWLMQDADNNLPFILYENCYDVWLANSRGTKYSIGHEKYNASKHTEYWEWSFNEWGQYDFPALVEMALRNSGTGENRFKKLNWIGHSLGSATFLIGMHYHPKLNANVRKFVAMAPAAYLGHTTSGASLAAMALPEPLVELLSKLFFKGKFTPATFDNLVNGISPLCNRRLATDIFCKNFLYFIAGVNPSFKANPRTLARVGTHSPSSTSVRTFTHLIQLMRTNKFEGQRRYLERLNPILNNSALNALLSPVTDLTNSLDGILLPQVMPIAGRPRQEASADNEEEEANRRNRSKRAVRSVSSKRWSSVQAYLPNQPGYQYQNPAGQQGNPLYQQVPGISRPQQQPQQQVGQSQFWNSLRPGSDYWQQLTSPLRPPVNVAPPAWYNLPQLLRPPQVPGVPQVGFPPFQVPQYAQPQIPQFFPGGDMVNSMPFSGPQMPPFASQFDPRAEPRNPYDDNLNPVSDIFRKEVYRINRTVVPTMIVMAKEDGLTSPRDVIRTASELGTPIKDKRYIQYLQSTHLDMLYNDDAKERIFDRIVDFLESGRPKSIE